MIVRAASACFSRPAPTVSSAPPRVLSISGAGRRCYFSCGPFWPEPVEAVEAEGLPQLEAVEAEAAVGLPQLEAVEAEAAVGLPQQEAGFRPSGPA